MARKQLTPEQIADAERVARKHGWNPEHVRLFMSLPDNVAEWDKKELSQWLKNRDVSTRKSLAALSKVDEGLAQVIASQARRIKDLEKAVRELCRGGTPSWP